MKTSSLEAFDEIFEKHANTFRDHIRSISSIGSKLIHTEKSDFPVFKPANEEYFEFKFFEGMLERYIREHLITPVFVDLLKYEGKTVYEPEYPKRYFAYSNEAFGKDIPFAFIINQDGKNVGIRYSSACFDDITITRLFKKYNLHKIEIINWDMNSPSHDFIEWGVSPKYRGLFPHISLQQYFEAHYSDNYYPQYIQSVTEIVRQANLQIGFNTISDLSVKNLSTFKESVLKDLRSQDYEHLQYQEFDKDGRATTVFYSPLPCEDYSIIKKRVDSLKLLESLVSNADYAKCFNTSEYFYRQFKGRGDQYFDYSSVATGYFKSVELLLKRILDCSIKYPNHDDWWIKTKDKINGKKIDDISFRYDPRYRNSKGKLNPNKTQTKVVKDNQKFFATEMGPLIYYVQDRTNGWYIKRGLSIVFDCLKNYNQCCRNEHLHKDIITEIYDITAIRNNTILCLFYLLGGCWITGADSQDILALGIQDDKYKRFDRLYKRLIEIPRGVCFFLIQFAGDEPVKAIRLFDQELPQYDQETGVLISDIKFVVVDDFSIGDSVESYESLISNISKQNSLTISSNNIPSRMWWYSSPKGRVEITW